MPELPEVETTRRGLEPVMQGRTIADVTLNRLDLRMPIPKDFVKRVRGQKVLGLRRRAKYMLIDLASGESILVHLGMSGSMRTTTLKTYTPLKHDHVLFRLTNDVLVVFHDPRRFGVIDLVKTQKSDRHKLLIHLGPEPLSEDFDAAYLQRRLQARKGPIKAVIMDQTLVVGVGNIYASESLFLAKIHPQTPAHNIGKHAEVLVKSIQCVLRDALNSGGSTLRDYRQSDGTTGYFQHRFNVYEREGEPCVACGREIIHIVQSGRASYFCGTCQPNISLHKKPRISKA